MPRVPVLQGPQVQENALGPGTLQAPDVSAGLRALTGGLNVAVDVLDKVVERNDKDVAWKTEANLNTEFAKFDADLRKQSQGRNALGYAEKVKTWWDEQSKTVGENLTPSQKAIIGRSLGVARAQSFQGALSYQNQELERSAAESFASAQIAEIQRAAASGDPAVAAASVELLKQRNAQRGTEKGWTPEVLADANMKATTALHANVIQTIQQRDPTTAMRYFEANKADIDGTKQAEISKALTTAVAANDGDNTAQAIWGELGPKGYNDPVAIDKMEQRARDAYKNDPARRQAALSALRERAVAHNAAQNENNAAAVNSVMGVYNQTKSLAAMKRSPAWSALPGAKQLEVENAITNMQHVALQRDEAARNRAQRDMERGAFGAYLQYSNPDVLAKMSEAEVQALLPVMGNALTGHLMEKKRSTKTPASESEAKIDKQDFDHIANTMGLKPFDSKKSEDEKAQLGELQYRVEQMIYTAQKAKGKALTREEKNTLMRDEMARTVKVGGFFGDMFANEKAVINLTADDVKNVVVPMPDRTALAKVMRAKYEATRDPDYAPTETNLRKLYLLNQSRSAKLLPYEAPANE